MTKTPSKKATVKKVPEENASVKKKTTRRVAASKQHPSKIAIIPKTEIEIVPSRLIFKATREQVSKYGNDLKFFEELDKLVNNLYNETEKLSRVHSVPVLAYVHFTIQE